MLLLHGFGRANGAMLVLLDLSAAFDNIDHDDIFCILPKYVGICGNALKLIKYMFKLMMFCQMLLILWVCSTGIGFRIFKI